MTQDIKIATAEVDYTGAIKGVRIYRAISAVILTAILFFGLVALVMYSLDKQGRADCLTLQADLADVRSAGAVPVVDERQKKSCADNYGVNLNHL